MSLFYEVFTAILFMASVLLFALAGIEASKDRTNNLPFSVTFQPAVYYFISFLIMTVIFGVVATISVIVCFILGLML